ncbi:MAG: ATP-binding cassette domain-containing protein [Paludibacteraceae bacterium]|nr:ATP-binding cassette domain-containing protein [Paludibacteraceae bacterium]
MAINISHLNKHIGKQHVLKDICLSIGDGEVVGLLGPNGAGKSTLMKILVGVWEPTSTLPKGQEMVLQVPKNIGFLPEQNPLYEDMYVREYLRFFVGLRSKEQGAKNKDQLVEHLIARVGLTAEANKRVGQLSKGYKQRVGLAQAIIGDPELLILDEPTTGLDPNQLEDIRALIREMGKDRTVILSTHILQEVKQMCSRVIIIDHGEIKVDKPISEIEDLEETFKQATKNE